MTVSAFFSANRMPSVSMMCSGAEEELKAFVKGRGTSEHAKNATYLSVVAFFASLAVPFCARNKKIGSEAIP